MVDAKKNKWANLSLGLALINILIVLLYRFFLYRFLPKPTQLGEGFTFYFRISILFLLSLFFGIIGLWSEKKTRALIGIIISILLLLIPAILLLVFSFILFTGGMP